MSSSVNNNGHVGTGMKRQSGVLTLYNLLIRRIPDYSFNLGFCYSHTLPRSNHSLM